MIDRMCKTKMLINSRLKAHNQAFSQGGDVQSIRINSRNKSLMTTFKIWYPVPSIYTEVKEFWGICRWHILADEAYINKPHTIAGWYFLFIMCSKVCVTCYRYVADNIGRKKTMPNMIPKHYHYKLIGRRPYKRLAVIINIMHTVTSMV